MRIIDIKSYPLSLPMKQPFITSNGAVGEVNKGAPHVYVRITADDGTIGWGEARPSHRWSYETLESVTTTIDTYLTPSLMGMDPNDFNAIHRVMNREIRAGYGSGQPIAKAAINIALHDLIGRANNKTLSELWYGASTNAQEIKLSYLISTADPQEAEQKAAYARDNGYEGLDVKLGLNLNRDIAILEAVKGAAPSLWIRADANQAYNLPQAVALAKQMERIGVDVFEQPMAANQLHSHAELRRKTTIPIALDESIWSPSDVIQAIRTEACDSIVIKVTKMGGLTGAKLSGEIAREAGLGLLGGGLTESTLGLAASAQLFHFLSIEQPVDLNGPLFLEDDPIEAPAQIENGRVLLPTGYGTGCQVSMDKINQYKLI